MSKDAIVDAPTNIVQPKFGAFWDAWRYRGKARQPVMAMGFAAGLSWSKPIVAEARKNCADRGTATSAPRYLVSERSTE
ncbi:hypothetical protein [Bradyrhizobium sp. SSUT77]|uniref:hypothetical protein n=1 Tax=Bradyrhizobium sp. SSUT77 TaxID=3040603 RepID=UPI00244A5E61|nr:hypothetical protein [Bradyrhizobium sp. SSUT77]MDH2347647.1 hypothetical protein [Bradyrhizobium sp. SSUT77]